MKSHVAALLALGAALVLSSVGIWYMAASDTLNAKGAVNTNNADRLANYDQDARAAAVASRSGERGAPPVTVAGEWSLGPATTVKVTPAPEPEKPVVPSRDAVKPEVAGIELDGHLPGDTTPVPVKEKAKPTRTAPAAAPAGSSAASSQKIAKTMVADRGWGEDQFSCLVTLWNRESGWNHTAANPSSSAYGIPQSLPGSKMSTAGADWKTNPKTQITWGLQYISGRYGTPCAALAHSDAKNWY